MNKWVGIGGIARDDQFWDKDKEGLLKWSRGEGIRVGRITVGQNDIM